MEHVAYMNKKWQMIEKILNGQKTIESRWYLHKCHPYGMIDPGDTIYFKNSGQPVTAKATVEKVLQYHTLTPDKIKTILNQYGKQIGIKKNEMDQYFQLFKHKKYAILIFLKDIKPIKPFDINKTKAGYCPRAAWVSAKNIEKIKN